MDDILDGYLCKQCGCSGMHQLVRSVQYRGCLSPVYETNGAWNDISRFDEFVWWYFHPINRYRNLHRVSRPSNP